MGPGVHVRWFWEPDAEGGDAAAGERAGECKGGADDVLSVRGREDLDVGWAGEVRDIHARRFRAGLCGAAVLRGRDRAVFYGGSISREYGGGRSSELEPL